MRGRSRLLGLLAVAVGLIVLASYIARSPAAPPERRWIQDKVAGREHAKQVAATLPIDNSVRAAIERGQIGHGVELPYHPLMRKLGIKGVEIEVYTTWFLGPRALSPVRFVYLKSYDKRDQITDPASLAAIRSSGIEHELGTEAVRLAPHGAWLDLPHSMFVPFRAATAVTLWDDPWLPSPPQMFTTFGPGKPPLVAAIGFGDLADIDRLLGSGKIDHVALQDALPYACSGGNPATLQRLLKAGAVVTLLTPNEEAGTCLMSAIWAGSPDLVKILLNSGAKPDGPQGMYGDTPLTLAAAGGPESAPIVQDLVDAGANVNAATYYGLTPLMQATNRQPPEILELLLKHGANGNAKSNRGVTALMFAAERGKVEAVKVLLAGGADTSLRDNDGQTASQMAANSEIANLIAAAGDDK